MDPYGRLAERGCVVCRTKNGLKVCSSCKVVSYCSTDHQKAHRSHHKAACTAIRKTRESLEAEEVALRADPEDFFNTHVGRFWRVVETRDYMGARLEAAKALVKAKTFAAVEAALNHLMELLRLSRSDAIGARSMVPSLLLRLGREQECYDFIKWWATVNQNKKYDWADLSLPYLDIHDANAFEPVNMLEKGISDLSHLVILTLLKLRMYLDLGSPLDEYDLAEDSTSVPSEQPEFSYGIHRPKGRLVRTRLSRDPRVRDGLEEKMKKQYHQLLPLVHKWNPHFWEALVEETDGLPSLPMYFSRGSQQEVDLVLFECKDAWLETEDSIIMIEADTSKFTRVYRDAEVGPATSLVGHSEQAGTLKTKKFTATTFPSKFKPSFSDSPKELFPAICWGVTPDGDQVFRFVHVNGKAEALVYVDGACVNNGQVDPRAGWAIVRGPSGDFAKNQENTVAGRLACIEPIVPTSNRAELQASINALRVFDWTHEGFTGLVIATDSSYVVDGATSWVKGWVRNGWTTKTGRDVKNRDLWEQLLSDMEAYKTLGLKVELWKIPREFNGDADAAAKAAAQKAPLPNDAITFSAPAAGIIEPSRRIIGLCLESDPTDWPLKSLVSQVTSKTAVEWAKSESDARALLRQTPRASVILISDAAIKNERELWGTVIDKLIEGATVVLFGFFSTMVTEGQFQRLFAAIGLPWKRGSYHRETVHLNTTGPIGSQLARRLPKTQNLKSLYVANIEPSMAWYTDRRNSNEAAVAFAQVGKGRLGYIGDVNSETEGILAAMCGFLD